MPRKSGTVLRGSKPAAARVFDSDFGITAESAFGHALPCQDAPVTSEERRRRATLASAARCSLTQAADPPGNLLVLGATEKHQANGSDHCQDAACDGSQHNGMEVGHGARLRESVDA